MNVDFQQINSILDAHDQAFRRRAKSGRNKSEFVVELNRKVRSD